MWDDNIYYIAAEIFSLRIVEIWQAGRLHECNKCRDVEKCKRCETFKGKFVQEVQFVKVLSKFMAH